MYCSIRRITISNQFFHNTWRDFIINIFSTLSMLRSISYHFLSRWRLLGKAVENKIFYAYAHQRSVWRCIMGLDHGRYRHRVAAEEEHVGVGHTWCPLNHRRTILWTTNEQHSKRRPKTCPTFLVGSMQPSRSGSALPSIGNRRRRIRGRRLEPHGAPNYEY